MARVLRSTHVRLVATVLVAALALTALIGRDDTAEAIDPGVDVVYVADGRSFADALVGSVLAAMNNAPLLTVEGNPPDSDGSVPPDTVDELNRLDPIGQIRIFGGPIAVTDKVLGDLESFTTPPGNVDRIAGDTRFDTAAEIATALPEMTKNADQLDGMDSSDFLGATDPAGGDLSGTYPNPDLGSDTVGADELEALESWHIVGTSGEPAFNLDWDHYSSGAYARVAFRKDNDGIVHLRGGGARPSDSGSLTTMFTLPEGYRPAVLQVFPVASTDGGGNLNSVGGVIEVDPDGSVRVYGDSDDRYVGLSGVYFDTTG